MTYIPRMQFGKYKGNLLRNVETNYLLWVCRENSANDTNFKGMQDITKELKRRGVTVQLVLDSHAIQRAEQRLAHIYREKARKGEPINKWLMRVFNYVLKHGEAGPSYTQRKGKKFKHRRYEYFYQDSVNGHKWKFVTQGNDVAQRLITVFPPGINDTDLNQLLEEKEDNKNATLGTN